MYLNILIINDLITTYTKKGMNIVGFLFPCVLFLPWRGGRGGEENISYGQRGSSVQHSPPSSARSWARISSISRPAEGIKADPPSAPSPSSSTYASSTSARRQSSCIRSPRCSCQSSTCSPQHTGHQTRIFSCDVLC